MLFLEPFLKWLVKILLESLQIPSNPYATPQYLHDGQTLLANDKTRIQPQISKLIFFVEWAKMDLNVTKCKITCHPNTTKLNYKLSKHSCKDTSLHTITNDSQDTHKINDTPT